MDPASDTHTDLACLETVTRLLLRGMKIVSSTKDLSILIRRARTAGIVGVDTEFRATRTYYPKLALIQIGLSHSDVTLVDPLAIPDLGPLGKLLADRKVTKVLHSPQQDLQVLFRATGTVPSTIYDTQKAAGFVGMPADLSLGNLVSTMCDVTLEKSETLSNWLRRPLSARQLAYAADDVRYLCRAHRELSRLVSIRNLQKWVTEEMQLFSLPEAFEPPDPANEWLKFGRLSALGEPQRAALQALAAWRLKQAQSRNLPVPWILSNETVYAIARQRPEHLSDLRALGLPPKWQKRYGNSILHLVRQHQKTSLPLPARVPITKTFKARVRIARDIVARLARAKGIDPSLVASKKNIAKYLAGLDSPLRHGWRYECAGHALDHLVSPASVHKRKTRRRPANDAPTMRNPRGQAG